MAESSSRRERRRVGGQEGPAAARCGPPPAAGPRMRLDTSADGVRTSSPRKQASAARSKVSLTPGTAATRTTVSQSHPARTSHRDAVTALAADSSWEAPRVSSDALGSNRLERLSRHSRACLHPLTAASRGRQLRGCGNVAKATGGGGGGARSWDSNPEPAANHSALLWSKQTSPSRFLPAGPTVTCCLFFSRLFCPCLSRRCLHAGRPPPPTSARVFGTLSFVPVFWAHSNPTSAIRKPSSLPASTSPAPA